MYRLHLLVRNAHPPLPQRQGGLHRWRGGIPPQSPPSSAHKSVRSRHHRNQTTFPPSPSRVSVRRGRCLSLSNAGSPRARSNKISRRNADWQGGIAESLFFHFFFVFIASILMGGSNLILMSDFFARFTFFFFSKELLRHLSVDCFFFFDAACILSTPSRRRLENKSLAWKRESNRFQLRAPKVRRSLSTVVFCVVLCYGSRQTDLPASFRARGGATRYRFLLAASSGVRALYAARGTSNR
jgi:hypothetical protein